MRLIEGEDVDGLTQMLAELTPTDTALAVSRLSGEEQARLLILLEPVEAAEVIEDIPETQAVALIEQLEPERAAAIMDELHSDEQVDLLSELRDADAEAILDQMEPAQAEDARQLMTYASDTAGGLMTTEYVAIRVDQRVQDAMRDLHENQELYRDFNVQYIYVVDADGVLVGVMPLRSLLFASRDRMLRDVMIVSPSSVNVNATLDEMRDFFDGHGYLGAPVIDDVGRLVGVLSRASLQQAITHQEQRGFLRFSGIVGGEEFRSMPLVSRSGRRLAWLSINIVLNIVAASVIAMYTDTLSAVITLAVFLPMISDMSGCSGNQAVAVSMRELSLGLVRPGELIRVLSKELGVGLINGMALGMLLGLVAFVWKGNPYLGLVVGGALGVNTLVAVLLGGALPLVLKRMKLDPALVSGPLLTTVTDMCGFFFALSFATAAMSYLA
ncbi:MAG: magnesium transporter [Planctomycetota bacterium]